MFKSACVLLLLFILQTAHAQADNPVDKLAKQGSEQLYNFEFKQAEQIFSQIKQSYPSDPTGYYYQAQIYLWSYLGNPTPEGLQKFINSSETAIEKAKAIEGNADKSEYANLLLGNLYTQRVLAFGKAEKFVDMAWAGKKAHGYLSDVLAVNAKNADAYLGIGLFKVALSQIPSAFRYVLALIGMDGDVKEGVQYLKSAANKATLTRVESQFYYAQIASDFLEDYTTSIKVLQGLQKQYPGNALFRYTLGVTYIKNFNLPQAGVQLHQCLQSKSTDFRQLKSFTMFLLGDVYFKENSFQNASLWYKRFIEDSHDKSYTGIAALRLAYCYAALGNSTASKSALEKAATGSDKVEEDALAAKRATWFLKYGINEEELALVRFSHLIEQRKYQVAVDSLQTLQKHASGKVSVAEVHFRIGLANHFLGRHKAATESFIAAANLKDYHQQWITAFSCLFASRSFFLGGNSKLGREYLGKAEGISSNELGSKLKLAAIAIKYTFNQF